MQQILIMIAVLGLSLGLAQGQTARNYIEFKGFIGSYSAASGYLTIGGLRVELKQAKLEGRLGPGVYVEAKGILSGTTLQASKVEVDSAHNPAAKTRVQLKGYVDTYDARAAYLSIAGLRVELGDGRVFGTLVKGAWVEVRGDWVGKGIQANRVEVSNP